MDARAATANPQYTIKALTYNGGNGFLTKYAMGQLVLHMIPPYTAASDIPDILIVGTQESRRSFKPKLEHNPGQNPGERIGKRLNNYHLRHKGEYDVTTKVDPANLMSNLIRGRSQTSLTVHIKGEELYTSSFILGSGNYQDSDNPNKGGNYLILQVGPYCLGIINAHLDAKSATTRQRQAEALLMPCFQRDDVDAIIFMGDLNERWNANLKSTEQYHGGRAANITEADRLFLNKATYSTYPNPVLRAFNLPCPNHISYCHVESGVIQNKANREERPSAGLLDNIGFFNFERSGREVRLAIPTGGSPDDLLLIRPTENGKEVSEGAVEISDHAAVMRNLVLG
jgi:hypothetical protein